MALLPPLPGGLFDGPLHRFAVRAYFEDTDLSGVVYHANYLRWFERARSDMLRLLGIDQRAAQEAGEGAYAVADLSIRYAAPARLDDDVLIESRVEEMGAASVPDASARAEGRRAAGRSAAAHRLRCTGRPPAPPARSLAQGLCCHHFRS